MLLFSLFSVPRVKLAEQKRGSGVFCSLEQRKKIGLRLSIIYVLLLICHCFILRHSFPRALLAEKNDVSDCECFYSFRA